MKLPLIWEKLILQKLTCKPVSQRINESIG